MSPGAAVAQVNCHDHISRVPMAAAAPAKARPARVHTVVRPAAARAKVQRTHRAAAAKPRPKRVAQAHRARPRPAVRPAAGPAPTPYLLAAQAVSAPVTYALIHVTTCDSAPPTMRLMSLRGAPAPETIVDDGDMTFLDAEESGGFGGPGGFGPPGDGFPGGGLLPPGGGEPPPIQPPIGPPITPPIEPPTAVPEPATWALMLLGFGALGAALRRRGRLAAPRRN